MLYLVDFINNIKEDSNAGKIQISIESMWNFLKMTMKKKCTKKVQLCCNILVDQENSWMKYFMINLLRTIKKILSKKQKLVALPLIILIGYIIVLIK